MVNKEKRKYDDSMTQEYFFGPVGVVAFGAERFLRAITASLIIVTGLMRASSSSTQNIKLAILREKEASIPALTRSRSLRNLNFYVLMARFYSHEFPQHYKSYRKCAKKRDDEGGFGLLPYSEN